ncbi:hypothetical protein LP122_01540 [Moraxella bovis]|nr:hypothetical protein [Moraxella bovis]UYZ68823.1 hypothetical protein LP122_01540 [Moraxella bovis]
MENGKWKMENGKWKMENGKWKMENGKWKMENGKWKMENSFDGMVSDLAPNKIKNRIVTYPIFCYFKSIGHACLLYLQ